MKKIRLLVDCHYFDAFYSGVTTYIKGIYNELVNYDDIEVFLAATKPEKLAEEFQDERFRFIELKNKSRLKRAFYEIPNLIHKYRIEYAHFQYIIPLFKKCKYIVTIHDILFEDHPRYFPLTYRIPRSVLFQRSAKNADIVLTVSEYSRRQISSHHGIDYKKIIVTPNAACGKCLLNKELCTKNSSDNYILYVSRLELRKNHRTLIEAFVELKLYEQYRLVLIGRPCIKDKGLWRYIKKLNESIKQKIQFIDNVADDELKFWYRNASLFVYPSLAEGFGIPPLEAVMNGVKTICSNATALSDCDFLKDYQFNPLDKEMLKSFILKTLNGPNYPFAQLQTAIRNKYNWSAGAKMLFEWIMKDAERCGRVEMNNLILT